MKYLKLLRILLNFFFTKKLPQMSKEQTKEVSDKLEQLAAEKAPTSKERVNLVLQQIGIKETKEVMNLAVSIVQAVRQAKANDGVIDIRGDFQFFIQPATLLIPAIDGGNKIAAEWGDLDEAEKAELAESFDVLVSNPRFRRLFVALVEVADATIEIVQESQADEGQESA